MKMSPLFLLILGVSRVYSDSHSLQYYHTAVSGTGSGLPEFSAVGYVDDQQIVSYNSNSNISRPVAQWMNKEVPEYWNMETQYCQEFEPMYKHIGRTVMSHFNQTGGFHFVQLMSGCELRDDGSTAGYEQYGYDGRDFMYLDTQRWVFIPTIHEAQITTQRWNSPEVREWERDKNYLENLCIESLKRYISYGRDDLERRVTPEVKVKGLQSDGVTKLNCWVYGFYPRTVDVKWMKNEIDEVPLDVAKQILPNPDGTYQTRVTVEVPAGEEDSYTCHVDHSSLEETLKVKWDHRPIGVIIGSVIGCLVVLALVIAGVLIYKKNTSGYSTTSTSETSSDSLNTTVKA